MSQAAATTTDPHAADAHHEEQTNTGIANKKLMMWLFLASDCMFFGTLISTHLIYRKLYPAGAIEDGVVDIISTFDIELTSFSTFILLMSSFLMALAVSALHKGQIKSFRNNCMGVIVFGLIFLGCQVYEFQHFYHGQGVYEYTAVTPAGQEVSGEFRDVASTSASREEFLARYPGYEIQQFNQIEMVPGLSLQNSIFGTTFFIMTGTHGLHVAIGILWLLSLLVFSYSGKMTTKHAMDVEIAGLYWHFVDIVWIVIFTVVYLVEYI